MKLLELLEKFVNLFYRKTFRIFFWIFFSFFVVFSIYSVTLLQLKQEQKNRLPRLENECALQSKKIADKIQGKNNSIIYQYNYYYNDYLGKCFILLHGDGFNQSGKSDILLDAFTEEEMASCESHTSAPEIDFCRFRDRESHYSIENFKDFIQIYLENK
jgi:hypothetical protein